MDRGDHDLRVGVFRCANKQKYIDVQEFIEDSLFDYLDCVVGLDVIDSEQLFPVNLVRQQSLQSKGFALHVLDSLGVSYTVSYFDTPYVYTCSTQNFGALVFDNGYQYLAVYAVRGVG